MKDERTEKILGYLYGKGSASIHEVGELLQVSEATVRRDFKTLAARKLVQRTHGGILVPESCRLNPPVMRRRYLQAEAKRAIAVAASGLIKEDETVFLGNGSTLWELARCLSNRRNLTVITNSLPISELLARNPGINLIITGGFLRQPEHSLIGHLVNASLAELRADKVFMGIQGIHLQHGLTNNDIQETITDRAIFHFSSKVIVVADSTKLNKIKPSFVADFSAINTIVTDGNAPGDIVASLRALGLEVIIAAEGGLPEKHQEEQ